MTKNKKIILIILILASAVFAYTYTNKKEVRDSLSTEEQSQIKNEITLTSKVSNLSETEKDQLKSSVDDFMNEYKLPKGIQNSYALSIEKRKNDAVEMVVNKGEEGDLGNIVIHARKVGGVWQVDPSGGLGCTLEEFEGGDC
jgi:hypothetical protein